MSEGGTVRVWALAAVLVVAVVLRLILVAQGGQYFFGDERRYDRGIELYNAIRHEDTAAIRQVLARPEHAGFVVLGALATAVQHLCAQATPYGDWSHSENIVFTIKGAAGFLSLFSVLNIGLLYTVVRAWGGSEREAFGSALCLALANSGFYYSRHLLPYDASLSFALLSCWVGARQRDRIVLASVGAGTLAAGAYHIYNGYWYLVAVLALVHFLGGDKSRRARRAFAFALGVAGAGAAPVLIGLAAGGRGYWQTLVAFSNTVNFGQYAEGWSLPWEYLSHAEGVFGAGVLASIVAALAVAAYRRERLPLFAKLLLVALLASYGLLVLFSVGLGKFVVYARTTKPLAVMLCGLGGWALERVFAGRRGWRLAGWSFLAIAGGVNFLPHFTFIFPADAEIAVMREMGNPKRTVTFAGSLYFPVAAPVTRPDLVLVNAQMLYPLRNPVPLPEGRILFRFPHPLNYPPFQYECHSPRERALLRANPPSIELLQLPRGSAVPDNPPLAWRYLPTDRPDGRK